MSEYDDLLQQPVQRGALPIDNYLMQPVQRGALPQGQYAQPAAQRGRPTSAQLFDYLTSRGATRNEALLLTGAATSESRLNPTAIHDNGTGYGMFGHRLDRLDKMRAYAGTHTPDWQQQGAFALDELRKRPEAKMLASAVTPEDIARVQMFYERPRGFSTSSPESGDNYAGRLNTLVKYAGVLGRGVNGSTGPGTVDYAATGGAPQPEQQGGEYGGMVTQGRGGAAYNAPWPKSFDQPTMPQPIADALRAGMTPGVADIAHSYGLLPRPATLEPTDPARTFRPVDIAEQPDPSKRFAALGGDDGFA